MKHNRTQALGFVLEHRKKILKGLGTLLQILEKLPAGVSVAELVAAGKAESKKAESKKISRKTKAKAKKRKSKSSAKPKSAAPPAEPAPVAQPPVDDALM